MTTQIFKRPIIILSAPRSGSTLLFETLSKAKDIWTIGDESHAIIEHIPKFSTVFRGFKSNALSADDADDENIEILKQRFKSLLIDRNGQLYNQDENSDVRFMEKTPKNALRVKFLNKIFPDALFIFLVRDPRENISSIIDAWHSKRFRTYPNLPGFNGEWSLFLPPNWQKLVGKNVEEIAAYQWQVSNESILNDLTTLPANRYKVINYQQLIDDPKNVLAEICEFSDIAIDEQFSQHFQHGLPLSKYTLTPPNKNKWHSKAHLIAPQISNITGLVDRLNTQLVSNKQSPLSVNIAKDLIDSAELASKASEQQKSEKLAPTLIPVSRNAICPCGSNKRYKHCHGQLT
ncbi:sulfotransferase [Colwelliaceae bacterium BS250]